MKLLAIGLDGASLGLLEELMSHGQLPYFEELLREGMTGEFETTIPTETPVAIPSICSGKNPGKIGVSGFLKKSQDLMTSRDLPDNMIWELLSQKGICSLVISVPLTYPATELDGYMISDSRYIPSRESNYTYPPKLKTLAHDFPIGNPERCIDRRGYFDADVELENLTRDMDKKFEVTMRILEEKKVDFTLLYINETDTMHHRIWTRKEHMFRFYKRVESNIRELVQKGDCRNIIVFSDHGNEKYPDYCFNVNTWLMKEGFLKLGKRTLHARVASMVYQLPEQLSIIKKVGYKVAKVWLRDQRVGVKPPGIDWESTIAYSNDFGIIIFPEHIQAEEGYESVRNIILKKMGEIKGIDGEQAIAKVCRREDMYWGDKLDSFPDILFLTKGYQPNVIPYSNSVFTKMDDRVSREGALLEGTHVTVLASRNLFIANGDDFNKEKALEGGSIYDIVPTILHLFGIPVPDDVDGKVPDGIFRDGSEPALRQVEYQRVDTEKRKIKNKIKKLKKHNELPPENRSR